MRSGDSGSKHDKNKKTTQWCETWMHGKETEAGGRALSPSLCQLYLAALVLRVRHGAIE
jgi:hypothetical protein